MMKEFMLLIREEMSRQLEMSEEAMQAEIEEYTAWVEGLSETDNYGGGDPLDGGGRYINADGVQTDGPFIESKEAVMGYIILKANDLDHATELARGCPVFKYGGAAELREIMKM